MTHTYRFANADNTAVVRSDGAVFGWEPSLTPAENAALMSGRLGEDYRLDGSPMPESFHTPAAPKKSRKSAKKLPKAYPFHTPKKVRAKK